MNLIFPYRFKRSSSRSPDRNPYELSLHISRKKSTFLSRFYILTDPFFSGKETIIPEPENPARSDSSENERNVEWELNQGMGALLIKDLSGLIYSLTPYLLRDYIKYCFKQLYVFFSVDEFELDELPVNNNIFQAGEAADLIDSDKESESAASWLSEKRTRIIQFADAVWDIIYRSLLPHQI